MAEFSSLTAVNTSPGVQTMASPMLSQERAQQNSGQTGEVQTEFSVWLDLLKSQWVGTYWMNLNKDTPPNKSITRPPPPQGLYLLSWHSAELTKLTKKSIGSWWICTRTQKTNTNQTYLTLAKSLHCSLWHSAGNPLLQQTRSGKGHEANIYVFPSQSLHNCSPVSLQHAWCSQTHYTEDM